MATQLTGSPQEIEIGEGYRVRAPGVQGTAELRRPRSAADRSRARASEDGTDALDAALANTNVTEVRQVELQLRPTPAAGATRSLRSADGQEMLQLLVPDLGPETGQVVLACDETGVLTWHLPVDERQHTQTPSKRGADQVKRFLIPATQPHPADADKAAKRSLLGVIGKKLLKVLVYPVLDPVVGKISEVFAERWEGKKRPYGLRDFAPDNFRDTVGPEISGDDWQRIASGRALLFIHGTFSTAHSAFSQIPDSAFAELHQRYGGRVLAFNHHSLSHDPRRNVEWLLTKLPDGKSLEIDIVCHSRGGLVARTLAQHPSRFGLDTSRVRVRRVVFVGVPNNGTLLAHPDHMVKMLDRLTTALNLFPTGVVTETLEAIITVVKVIGHGALGGLDGLAAMRPGGAFLNQLNAGQEDGVGYYAVGADYEPVDEGLKALLTGKIADTVMDRVFQKVPNDLVVPTPGVYGANGCTAFPIEDMRCLKVPVDAGIIHTTLFGYPPVMNRLVEWLAADGR
ncbi:MAG: esterase/lipase family protein [Desulfobacterales bacterium]